MSSLLSKLEVIKNTKEAIRETINSMNGGGLGTDVPFAQYPNYIPPISITGTISGNCTVSYVNASGELVQISNPGQLTLPRNSFISVLTDIDYISNSDPSYSGCQQVDRFLGGSTSIIIIGYTKAYVYYVTDDGFNISC